RFEKSDDVEVIRALALGHLLGCESERNPELDRRGEVEARMGKLEIGGHYADDRVIPVVQSDAAAGDVRFGPQALLPELMADDHHIVAPRLVLFWRNQSALRRPGAEHRKEVGRHARPGDAIRLPAAREVEIIRAERRDGLEAPRLIAIIDVLR